MFNILVVTYLFLGGTGAGICTVLGILGLMVPGGHLMVESLRATPVRFLRYDPVARIRIEASISDNLRRLFGPCYGLAALFLLVGIACLMVDLGRLDRVFNLLLSPQATYLTIGAYALVICGFLMVAMGLVFARIVHHCPYWLLRAMQVLSIPVGVVVMLYTGLMLATMPAVPLWNMWCLPVLFLCSALSCGMACVAMCAHFSESWNTFPTVMRRLLMADAVIMVVEIGVLVAYVSLVPKVWPPVTPTGVAAAQSLDLLLQGSRGVLFQVGYVVAGLVVPVLLACGLIYLSPRAEVSLRPFMMVTGTLVVIGGFIMRWCVVMAGVQPELLVL